MSSWALGWRLIARGGGSAVRGGRPAAAGGGAKIAYVNTRASSGRRPATRQAESTFTKELETYRGEVHEAAGDARFRRERLRAAVGHAEPDPAHRQAEGAGDAAAERSRSALRSCSSSAATRERELLDPIQTKVNSVIEGVRAAGNYAMIFDVSAPNSGIVTADKSLDLTQRVIQQLKSGS